MFADDRIVLLSGDIGNRLFDKFREKFPERFINCGIAEANMIGVAAGLAMNGFRPIAYTITPFITTRCLEQIRVDVCYHDVPVMIVVCARWQELTALDANLGRTVLTPGSSIYPAVQNMMLAARNEGLGTVLTTLLVLSENEIKKLLNIPEDVATAAVITLGWPVKPFPKKLKRKPLATTAFLDTYGAALPGAAAYV